MKKIGNSKKKIDPVVLILNKNLQYDVQNLENAKEAAKSKLELIKADFARQLAEVQGIEASIYSFFKADALSRGAMSQNQNQRIEFLGDFKYRLVEMSQQPPTPADQPEDKAIEDKSE